MASISSPAQALRSEYATDTNGRTDFDDAGDALDLGLTVDQLARLTSSAQPGEVVVWTLSREEEKSESKNASLRLYKIDRSNGSESP